MVVKYQLIKYRINIWIFILATFIANSSCSLKENKLLNQSLNLSGSNKSELEKVLNHYKNDILKLKAAKFLITNMPGSFSQNGEILNICIPFYDEYNALAKEYNYTMNAERGRKIDSLWNAFSIRNPQIRNLPFQLDLETISAEQLITEIDLAFKAWQENVYTKDCSFDEFCEYILPYKRFNGLVIDNAREKFYDRHKGRYFIQPGKDMIDEADSLLYENRHLTHSQFWGTQIPILTASTFEHLRHGLCEHRCWYNSLLFSSLGMAAAVDFVPAWGNRNNNHTWNVLIKDGKSYAFEAFWDDDRWKYKRIYNNETFDKRWGKFRLPKVYRQSFKNYIEGPIADKNVKIENIPPLFRNMKKKDVSAEYFEATDVTIFLNEVPKGMRYAYLCVFGYQQWHPVQWGKIHKNKVIFTGMGRDIVYLPVYYESGNIIPAGKPFLLDKHGVAIALDGNNETLSVNINHVEGSASYDWNRENIRLLTELSFTGHTSADDQSSDTLLILPDSLPMESVTYSVFPRITLNSVSANFRSDTIAVSEITFYDKKCQLIVPGRVESEIMSFDTNDSISFVGDLLTASGIKGTNKQRTIRFHFDDSVQIASIKIAPFVQNRVKNDGPFTLYHWYNNEWKEVETKTTQTNFLIFNHVPDNYLYMLRNQRWAKNKTSTAERIFIYREGEVLWY